MPTSADADGAWSLQLLNNALQGRFLIGSIFQAANPVSNSSQAMNTWRSGVLVTTSYLTDLRDLKVAASASPSMTLPVNSGTWVVNRPSQGPYLGWSSIVRNVVLDNGDPTNPRIDRVVARIYDSGIGDSLLKARIEVVAGTPAPSPSVPSVPAGAIPLARVAVAANATQITNANITDERQATAVQGGLRPMLPGDLVSDPGYVYGELRIRTRTDIPQELVEFWGKDGVWHKLNPIMPACVVYNNTAVAIATNANTYVNWTAPEQNDAPNGNPMFDPANPARITIQEDGLYICGASSQFTDNAPNSGIGIRLMWINKNIASPPDADPTGVNTVAYYDRSPLAGPSGGNTMFCERPRRLVAGDVLRCGVFQNSGSTQWLEGSSASGSNDGGPSRFWAYKIRD